MPETYEARMARIVKEDNARRFLRDYDAEASGIKTTDEGCDPYHVSRQITGVPSPNNRTHKATNDCWQRGLRGKAFGLLIHEGKELRTDAVIVRHGDNATVVPQSHFRAKSKATQHRESRETIHRMTAADMAPIQNYENDN